MDKEVFQGQSLLTRVEAFHHGDWVDEVSLAELALYVRVQLGDIEPPLLSGSLPRGHLGRHLRLRLLHGSSHFHPVLVLKRGRPR